MTWEEMSHPFFLIVHENLFHSNDFGRILSVFGFEDFAETDKNNEDQTKWIPTVENLSTFFFSGGKGDFLTGFLDSLVVR